MKVPFVIEMDTTGDENILDSPETIASRLPGWTSTSLDLRCEKIARIRQRMVDRYLTPEVEYVLMMDADIVAISDPMIALTLVAESHGDVVAPLVLLEDYGERFYDIAGFVQDGRWANLYPPYFHLDRTMDSVGCFYLIPAYILRSTTYHQTPGFTEHYCISEKARELGFGARVIPSLTVWHANLPKYGEAFH